MQRSIGIETPKPIMNINENHIDELEGAHNLENQSLYQSSNAGGTLSQS